MAAVPPKVLKALATHRFAQADSEPAEVRPGLLLGSIGAASNERVLDGVTHVLSLGGSDMLAHLGTVTRRKEAGLLRHAVVEIKDKSTEDLSAHLDGCVAFIDEALNPDTNKPPPPQLVGSPGGSGRDCGDEVCGEGRVEVETGRRGGSVLVHCFQGKSRSAGVVAAWLMDREGLTYVASAAPRVGAPNTTRAHLVAEFNCVTTAYKRVPEYPV